MRALPVSPSLPRHLASWLLLTGWLTACGPDLQPTPGSEEPDETPSGSKLSHVDNGDGTFVTTVDARSKDVWIGLDLDHRLQVDGAEDRQWDVAFQRFYIRVRGGVNGTGNVAVAMLSGEDFAQVSQAPADGYATDAAGSGEDVQNTVFETAGEGWYSYDPKTHKLSPRGHVYVVRTDEGAYFKVRFLSYYDEAGTPAMIQLHWGKVQPPSP